MPPHKFVPNKADELTKHNTASNNPDLLLGKSGLFASLHSVNRRPCAKDRLISLKLQSK